MSEQVDPFERAIQQLWHNRTFRHGDRTIEIAVLIREVDWRPLKASWWRGKEACIIGADLAGNFLLRHCDGTVRYWDHQSSTDSVIAPSVKAFATGITE
jgi:hypothetical protein